jgi:DNA-binding LytR/AlgR family response regulator
MIRALAIDDEPLALQLVESYIRKTPFIELAGTFDNPFDAMSFLEKEPVDLIFLDIQMPDLTGIEFARVLKGDSKIIFTTAFEQYALEGFKLEAIDYLLKPFSYEEFLKAAQRVNKLVELEKSAEIVSDSANDYMFLKSDYKIKKINFKDILYIEGLKDYVKVFVVNETNPVLSLNSLKSLEDTLPKSQFMRVHRSFIVNLDKITTVDRSRIVFSKAYIPIGDQYKDKFQEFIDKKLL